MLPKFTCDLIINETPTQVNFCEFRNFFKKKLSCRTPANDCSGF